MRTIKEGHKTFLFFYNFIKDCHAFPDVDGYDKWVEKCAERPYLNIQVSDYLQQHATDEDKRMGADIADVLIRWKLGSLSYVTPKPQEPPPEALYADNPVMR